MEVKISKILAGQEPIKTNHFLQSLGKVCEKLAGKNSADTKAKKATPTGGTGDKGGGSKTNVSKSKSNESGKGKYPSKNPTGSNSGRQPVKASNATKDRNAINAGAQKQPIGNKEAANTKPTAVNRYIIFAFSTK